jgi:hypothetical protein
MSRGAALVVCLALACRRGTPEEQVRRTVAAAETAAEERNVRALARLISERYRDGAGNDRAAVLDLLRFQLLTRPSIHLLTRVRSVELLGKESNTPASARVSLVAAMAAVPLSPGDLARARADLQRFELTLVEERRGDWRVVSATWSPARVEDFW